MSKSPSGNPTIQEVKARLTTSSRSKVIVGGGGGSLWDTVYWMPYQLIWLIITKLHKSTLALLKYSILYWKQHCYTYHSTLDNPYLLFHSVSFSIHPFQRPPNTNSVGIHTALMQRRTDWLLHTTLMQRLTVAYNRLVLLMITRS